MNSVSEMKLVPETIAGRTTAVLLIGFVLFHAASLWSYQLGLDSEIVVTNEIRLAERLITIKRTLTRLPPGERETVAHSLSGGPIEVHWSPIALTVKSSQDDGRSDGLQRRLIELAPELNASGLIIGVSSSLSNKLDDPHLLLVSMKLDDSSWANVGLTRLTGPRASLMGVTLSTTVMALIVLALSAVVLRSVTRPLRQCAATAKRLFVDAEPRSIPISGSREVRDLAASFNELQQRVKRLVDDRTLTLAAISHDLRTPLTRARLRVEDVANPELRKSIDADLVEMLDMIESALEFLKGDRSGETIRDVDLTAVLQSICDDMTDLGHKATFASSEHFVLRGRHLALKRALNNLIANAVKYGGSARIAAIRRGNAAEIMIDDDGQGIPHEQREAVFAPFFRLESSRNRATGGAGLGLTVARSIIRGHGGEITLGAAPSGGLRVTVALPLRQSEESSAQ